MDWCVPDLSRLRDLIRKLFEDVLEVVDSKMTAVAIGVVVVAVVAVVAVPLVTSAVLFGATRAVVRSVFGFGRAVFGFGGVRAIAR